MRPEKKPSAMPPARGEAIDQYRTVRTRNIGRTSASVAGMGRTVRINARSVVRNIAPRASWFTAASALQLRRGRALNGLVATAARHGPASDRMAAVCEPAGLGLAAAAELP